MLLLSAQGTALCDQDFKTPDGASWSVRTGEHESHGQYERRTLHVLRDGVEVATFPESSAIQSNPTMSVSTDVEFHVNSKGAPVATATHEKRKRKGDTETIDTTIVEHTWDGTSFVAGKPKTKHVVRRRKD